MEKKEIDDLFEQINSQEDLDYLLDKLTESKKQDYLYYWLQDNLLTRSEARSYTDQSYTAIGQSIRNGLLFPFFSKGDGPGKVNLFLKKQTIEYGENKRKNVPRKPEKK